MILRLFGVSRYFRSSFQQGRKLTTNAVNKPRIKFKWIVLGASAIGTSAFTLNLLLPDTRAELDPKHYYSDWRVCLFTSVSFIVARLLLDSILHVIALERAFEIYRLWSNSDSSDIFALNPLWSLCQCV